ncbi:hypothetical protein AZ008_002390 [Klebsiella pneumoniae]|nr:hypothetical protein L474_02172 [Escherichia coli BIDMC 37]KMH82601.1 hypothetical protein SM78_01129 [Klebsiella pneumoniae]MDD1408746.1 hypothetical protein [Escherichia coli]OUG95838.1 hypothetical protein AZ008_002390 [Klebsiella pneumoniae]OUH56219.1 hypothetical protein AZ028_002600 [Klebsiella pneumoniae]
MHTVFEPYVKVDLYELFVMFILNYITHFDIIYNLVDRYFSILLS